MADGTDGPLFDVRGVSRQFRQGRSIVRAVSDVDLRVHSGERLGIVGESGSGKSTLIKMMAGLDDPSVGSIYFSGQRIDHIPERRRGFLRSDVQVVFQDPRGSLDPRMKVLDIVTEPLRSRHRRTMGLSRSELRQRAVEVLSEVGLEPDMVDSYPHQFSGGQRQRLAIARALSPKPTVIIADEPVSALDVSVRAQILNLLMELIERDHLTLVFVSHDLNVVRHVCNTVAVMQGGRIVEYGETDRVYSQPQDSYTRQLLASIPRLP